MAGFNDLRRPIALVWIAVLGLLAAIVGTAAAVAAERAPVIAHGVGFGGDGDRGRFIVELDGPVDFNAFAVDEPPRIVIDMSGVAFALPAVSPNPGPGLVSDWRYGEIAPGRARIVLDVDGEVLPERSFYLPPERGRRGRLVVEFARVSPAAFAASVADSSPPAEPDAGPTTNQRRAPGSRPLVVIDPGHGGIDPGAVGPSGLFEKDLTLAFSKVLRDILAASGRVEVRLTREDDRFLSLGRRVEIAQALAADLFVSIHADAAPQSYVRGATVYTLSERPSDAEAAFMAARENSSDALAGLPAETDQNEVVDILADLTRRETRAFSRHFAGLLVDTLGESVRLIGNNPHRSARFRVLRAQDVPSVLLEIGYLSNEDDAELMLETGWRVVAAGAIAEAVDAFFAERRVAGEAGATPTE